MTDESTRNRILEAAGPVFATKGFRGSTVREICDAAKVNVASINYHFGDKSHLYVEIRAGEKAMFLPHTQRAAFAGVHP